jgi:hypothetical protein
LLGIAKSERDIVFGKHQTHGRPDLDRPEGCDHDQSVYHYRLVDGAMVLRGIALGHGWETRQMDWRGLSCYKQRGDMQMAQITQESGRPEPRADKDEIMAKAKVLIDGGMKVAQAARELGVPGATLAGCISKEKKQIEKAKALLESVDAGHVKSMGCIEVAPIGVEVPQYDPSDNDFADDEPIPYVVKPEPIDAQIDIMVDLYLADRKAKLKAHLKSLMADPEVMDAIKAMIGMGLIA